MPLMIGPVSSVDRQGRLYMIRCVHPDRYQGVFYYGLTFHRFSSHQSSFVVLSYDAQQDSDQGLSSQGMKFVPFLIRQIRDFDGVGDDIFCIIVICEFQI